MDLQRLHRGFAGTYERSSLALYGDLSADVTDRLFLQGAIRYEDYDDFDSETVWKLAGKYNVTEYFGIRASVGTGFRAPTPGQRNTTAVQTTVPDGVPVATGLFPAQSEIAQVLGASPLKPETATNLTMGFVLTVGTLDLTLDYYRIDIADVTYVSPLQKVSTDPTRGAAYANFLALEAAGFPGANTIGGVQYFASGFDTRNEGADLVATYPIKWGAGTTNLSLSMTLSRNKILAGDLTLIGRLSYYGTSETSRQDFDAVWFTDLEAQYQISDMFRISAGGRNLY